MNIATIGVEEWLNVWEKSAVYDIGQSTISSMTFEEIRALDEAAGAELFERLAAEKMSYGWIEGSDASRKRSPGCIAPSRRITSCRPTGPPAPIWSPCSPWLSLATK